MRQIMEMRRDKDTYHVVLGDIEPTDEPGLTAAVPVTAAMKRMKEGDRLAAVLDAANEQADEALQKARDEIRAQDETGIRSDALETTPGRGAGDK